MRERLGLRGVREWAWLAPVLLLLLPVLVARLLLLPLPGGIPMSLLGTFRFLMRVCAYPMAWSAAATAVAAVSSFDPNLARRFRVTLWTTIVLGWLVAATTAGRLAAL